MKNKIIVLLEEELPNIPQNLVFNNTKDLQDYFKDNTDCLFVTFDLDFNTFTLKTKEYCNLDGKIFWAKEI